MTGGKQTWPVLSDSHDEQHVVKDRPSLYTTRHLDALVLAKALCLHPHEVALITPGCGCGDGGCGCDGIGYGKASNADRKRKALTKGKPPPAGGAAAAGADG